MSGPGATNAGQTIYLAGNVTCSAFTASGGIGFTFNQQGYNLTQTSIATYGLGSPSGGTWNTQGGGLTNMASTFQLNSLGTSPMTVNTSSSIVTIGGDFLMFKDAGQNTTVNASSSVWNIAGKLDVSTGTFNAQNSMLTINRNFIGHSNGAPTFVPGNSTVIFSSNIAAQSVTGGGISFYNVVDSNTASGGLTFTSSFTAAQFMSNASALSSSATTYFEGNSTFTISTFSVTGSASQYVVLKSTSSAQWYLNNTASNNASYVYVSSSNAQATGGKTIFCSNCVDGGNNLGWNFNTSATFTWTGTADTNFGNYANWDVGAVPRSIDNIVIPNTTNKCLLDQNRTINSVNVNAGGGVLDLNNFNLTVSTFVTLVGTMTARGTEQISVGGNWNASGGLFNYGQSTVTFNGTGTFTILSAGTSFYDLNFNNLVSTWTLSDAMNTAADLTLSTGVFMTGPNYPIAVGRDWNVPNGTFYLQASTITVNRSAIINSKLNNYSTSTVYLNGTGNLCNPASVFSRLVLGNGITTTLVGNVFVGQSAYNGNQTGSFVDGDGTSLIKDNNTLQYVITLTKAVFTNNGSLWSQQAGLTIRYFGSLSPYFPGGNYGNVVLYMVQNSPVAEFSGPITAGTLQLNGNGGASSLKTDGWPVTVSVLFIGSSNPPSTGTVDFGTSTVIITNQLQMLGIGLGTLNASSSTILMSGSSWSNLGQFNAGISTVVFSSSTVAQSVFHNGEAFATVIASNTSAGGLMFTSSFTAAQFIANTSALSSSATTYFAGNSTFTISTFSVTGAAGKYVVLKSTGVAQWYLNNTNINSASFVYVSSSNAQASGGKTIFCSNCVDGGNNLGWNFNTPATFTWTGTADTNFGNYANWDVGAVPRSIDNIVIPNTTNKCLLDQNRTVNSVNVNAGGGVLDLNNFNLTVSTFVTLVGTMTARGNEQISVGGNWNATGGTFNAAQSTVTFNGAGAFTVTPGGQSFGNVLFNASGSTWTLAGAMAESGNVVFTAGNLTTGGGNYSMTVTSNVVFNGGSLNLNASTATVAGSWTFTSGAFNAGTSTVTFNVVNASTITCGGQSFEHLQLAGAALSGPVTLGGALLVSGNLTLTGPKLDTSVNNYWISIGGDVTQSLSVWNLNGSTVTAGGNWTRTSGVLNPGTSTVTFTSNGTVTISNVNGFQNLVFNGAGTFKNGIASPSILGNLTITQGTYDATAGPRFITVGGNWSNSGTGTFLAQTSTVNFQGTGIQQLSGSTTFYALQNSLNSGATMQFTLGTTQYVTSWLNLSNIGLQSTTSGSTWYFTYTGSSQTLNGVIVQDSNADGGSLMAANATSVNNGNNRNWSFGSGAQTLTWTGAVNTNWSNPGNWDKFVPRSGDNAVIVGATNQPTLTVGVTVSTLTINGGASLTLSGFNLTCSSITNAGNFIFRGTETVTSVPNNLAGSTVTYNATSGIVLLLSTWTYTNLQINGSGGTFKPQAAVVTNENLIVAAGTLDTVASSSYSITAGISVYLSGGILNLNSSTMSVTSNWSQTSGTFNGGSSTLTVVGNMTNSGGTYNAGSGELIVNGTLNNSGITFNANTSAVVLTSTNSVTLTPGGQTYNNLAIGGPSSTGLVGYWKLDDLAGLTALDSSGNGNNGAWNSFVAPYGSTTTVPGVLSGSDARSLFLDGSSAYVDITGNPAILKVNSGTVAAWIKTPNAVAGYRAIVAKESAYGIYLNSNILEVYDFGAAQDRLTGINLADGNWHHVAFSFISGVANGTNIYADGLKVLSALITVANQGVEVEIGRAGAAGQNFGGLIDDVRVYNRVLSAQEIAALAAGNPSTQTLAGNLTVNGDLTLAAGTLNANGNAVNVAGNWLNDVGGYTSGNNTVTLNGTSSGKNLMSNGQAFNNLIVNGSGGAWMMNDAATVAGNFTVTASTLNSNGYGVESLRQLEQQWDLRRRRFYFHNCRSFHIDQYVHGFHHLL